MGGWPRPLTFLEARFDNDPGGKSGDVGMAHCPLQQLMAWGVLPPTASVRRPLIGTCDSIADS
jgi:hypothetical protein